MLCCSHSHSENSAREPTRGGERTKSTCGGARRRQSEGRQWRLRSLRAGETAAECTHLQSLSAVHARVQQWQRAQHPLSGALLLMGRLVGIIRCHGVQQRPRGRTQRFAVGRTRGARVGSWVAVTAWEEGVVC